MKNFLLLILSLPIYLLANSFDQHWYDGNAEISTYKLTEMRYGEPREGVRIMVFVTEPLRLSTKIKPDTKLPPEERIKVIKLNDLRKFPTGIYEYSAMTSVFSAVENHKYYSKGDAIKVALTSQEWCGTVFERMVRDSSSYNGTVYSYFESEGETTYTIPVTQNMIPEDNMWIIVRELQGPIMKPGDSKNLTLLPSAWARRKSHVPIASLQTTLTKSAPAKVKTALGEVNAISFTWTFGNNKTTVTVEDTYPRRILSFVEHDGSKGVLEVSRREPYWTQNKNKDHHLRQKLKLPAY